jgi:hypothetical protein
MDQLQKYLKVKDQYLQVHRWFPRMRNLMSSDTPDSTVAEALDRDFERAARTAVNACRHTYRSPWSPKFASAWAFVNFYKLAKSQASNDKDYSAAIGRLQQRYPDLPQEIPTSKYTRH